MENQKEIRKKGYLKKQKTMKKKLFVLKEESENGAARLEYYDNEKKFVSGRPPKRSILLHSCFSINSKSDAKSKYAIVLYTREDCFTVVCDDEEEQNDWLRALVELRNYHTHGGGNSIIYEHIWPVTVKSKGLGSSKYLNPGQYRLCLTSSELSFVRPCLDQPDLVLQLASIRRCGHTECFFYLELGRTSATGSGDLWMQVEDIVIAQNMHETILRLMTASKSLGDQAQYRVRRHSNVDRMSKPSHSRQKSSPAVQVDTVRRSNTISAADHIRSPQKRRPSQSPSKSGTLGSRVRPRTISGNTSLPSSHTMFSVSQSFGDDSRSRTDSMESTGSRTTNSVSTDEIESPPDDAMHHHDTSTPKFLRAEIGNDKEISSYVPMDANAITQEDHPVSPIPGPEHKFDDYLDVSSGSSSRRHSESHSRRATPDPPHLPRASSKQDECDGYMEMGGNTLVEENVVVATSEVRQLSSRREEASSYMDMRVTTPVEADTYFDVSGVSRKPLQKDSGTEADYAEIDVGTDSATSSGPAGLRPPRTRSDSEYIPMNPQGQFLPIDDRAYMDMSCSSSTIGSSVVSSSSSLHDLGNELRQRAASGQRSLSLGEDEYIEVGQDSGYMPMEARSCSPRPVYQLRPDRVTSYLADESSSSSAPQRSYSLGSRQQVPQNLKESYMDMNGPQTKVVNTKGHHKASSTPLLSQGVMMRSHSHRSPGDKHEKLGHRSKTLDRSSGSIAAREEKDSLMEMTFPQRRPGSALSKDHEYEEIRPRSASGGSHDLLERRRTGSIGYREKLSKFASLARATAQEYKKSSQGHRPRIATISQDTFRKRTSSFGTSAADMRPRSSSYGNSRYVDMSGRLRRDISSQDSHDSLLRARRSHDSVNSATGEYLDMRPRTSTSPSQALVQTFKRKDKSQPSSKSDYLDMDQGGASAASSEYANMDLPLSSSRSSDGKALQKSRALRGSVSSGRGSHSSSESLASNNSQSSEGRGSDRSRGKPVTSTISENSMSLKPSMAVKRMLLSDKKSVDDSYVLYSPSSSRESSPHPESKLEKVACALRLDDQAQGSSSPQNIQTSTKPVKVKNDHEYINVDYDDTLQASDGDQSKRTSSSTGSSGFTSCASTDSGPTPSSSSRPPSRLPSISDQAAPRSEAPTRPCPAAPNAVNATASNVESLPVAASSSISTSDLGKILEKHRSSSTSREEESDYLEISPQGSKLEGNQASSTTKETRNTQETKSHNPSLPKLPTVTVRVENTQANAGNDYMLVSPVGSEKVCEKTSASSESATKAVKSRPKLPSMPVPFPSLGVVSPTAATVQSSQLSETPQGTMETPQTTQQTAQNRATAQETSQGANTAPAANDTSGYMELSFPSKTAEARRDAAPDQAVGGAAAVPLPPRSRLGQGQGPIRLQDQATSSVRTCEQLSNSNSSLNSLGERQLNYATLDLQSCSDDIVPSEMGQRSRKHPSGGSSAGSESPDEVPMQYAQIDFKKSQELRKNKKTQPPFDL